MQRVRSIGIVAAVISFVATGCSNDDTPPIYPETATVTVTAPPQTTVTTSATSGAAPSSSATPDVPVPIPDNGNGFTFVATKTGKTSCQISADAVGCQLQFDNPPRTANGELANGVNVTSNGSVTYLLGNLGDITPAVMEYRKYSARGWTITATSAGTTFVNELTGRGMFVSTEGVRSI